MKHQIQMRALTLADLKSPKKRLPKRVSLGGGLFAFVLNPTPDQADLAQMQWQTFSDGVKVGFTSFLTTWALCDESNNQLVDPGDSEKEVSAAFQDALESISVGLEYRQIKKLFDAAMQLFGLSDSDLRELEKNSDPMAIEDGNGCRPSTTD